MEFRQFTSKNTPPNIIFEATLYTTTHDVVLVENPHQCAKASKLINVPNSRKN